MMTAKEIISYMESLRNEEQRRVLMGFFKTGPGEYGEGDEFLGLKVPQTREVVKAALAMNRDPLTMNREPITIDEVPELLMSKWHEVRLCGLLILVAKFEKLTTKRLVNDAEAIKKRDEILKMYLKYAERANNWDLVDLSAPKILGTSLLSPQRGEDWKRQMLGTSLLSPQRGEDWKRQVLGTSLLSPQRGEDWKRRMLGTSLLSPQRGEDEKRQMLDELAFSDNLWKQRMSMVCTWKTSQMGDPSWCLRYAEIHLHHPHELMHKAVGWMLREMGKRCSMDLLRDFLRQHVNEMPRTMLRYAIEKMSEKERQYWMRIEN